MIANNVFELIGKTPVVKLNKIVEKEWAEIYLKLEFFNPAGSVKDRVAFSMIEKAEKEGKLKKGSVIIEPTSGNTGIGLAMVGAAKGYKVIIVMPDTMSMERRMLLTAYGAEVVLTPGKLGMEGAIKKAEELVRQNKNYFMPQQFENFANPLIHEETTAKEIIEDFNEGLDVFVAGVGTGGTITGVGKILKNKFSNIKIIGVEPYSAAVLSGKEPGPHKIQGIGAGFIPKVLDKNVIDEVIAVKDEDAFEVTRLLAKKEGILGGISTGASLWAAIEVAKKLGKGKKVLAIAPDSGERYLSTQLFRED
ncbi:cysteine synthase A [Thermoanaerobacter brockii subsp. lactiethylicus]|uniref:Cysteine synthase n=2 Tax=Thermoanaerobacter TaxID=1754 RepID=B0K950_THEP3|nr:MULTISPECIES: cysteine synthase A [Thermoanaerobacter]KUJ90523.1 MAG: cysteine synthase A [Thermoanaerobacter thermocopriae]ABY92737.1 cysteine synthase A [Thermoanaerobacter sp. X514]ABY94663.1 cysteine synthase A [Thermoanaerobacter pseudethanolicus ATCC 33223]ADV79610.1 cysteine synthase A [Thermoanaerobacter brockii subsp. finnii Ako-1]MBZ4656068.1 cysteine synthase [Thermoanaerobacter sp.]